MTTNNYAAVAAQLAAANAQTSAWVRLSDGQSVRFFIDPNTAPVARQVAFVGGRPVPAADAPTGADIQTRVGFSITLLAGEQVVGNKALELPAITAQQVLGILVKDVDAVMCLERRSENGKTRYNVTQTGAVTAAGHKAAEAMRRPDLSKLYA